MQVCVFSIKLGATNPTPSTVGESSKPRPPGGATGKFPLVTESRSGSACPPLSALLASCNASVRLREPGGKRTPGAQQLSAAGWALELPELRCTRNGHTALLREAPCAVGGPERSTSPTKGHSSLSSAGSALGRPSPRPGA